MKNFFSIILLLAFDIICIFLALIVSTYLRIYFDELFILPKPNSLFEYSSMPIFYIITLVIFFVEGFYTKRYDFWHESRILIKSVFIAMILTLAFFALAKIAQEYSRAIVVISFCIMTFLIPFQKYLIKKFLFKIKIWQKKAVVYDNDNFLKKEVFSNSYLGYIKSEEKKAKTLFVNSEKYTSKQLQSIFDQNIKTKKEIIFVPIINEYDFSNSTIYELFNAKINLIVLENNLLKFYNQIFKSTFDYLLAVLLLPLLAPVMLIIAFFIKKDDSTGTIFFNQKRMGRDHINFTCHKFRTMYHEQDIILKQYLKENPQEIENYKKYHKYKNDPRITPVGHFLRKTSLDELPQILNVLKGEMSFVGPRPYMLNEKELIGKKIDMVLTVKPGITGLWQVSGRSGVDFQTRVNLDVWYMRNWHFWMDIAILVKTTKAVFSKHGAS